MARNFNEDTRRTWEQDDRRRIQDERNYGNQTTGNYIDDRDWDYDRGSYGYADHQRNYERTNHGNESFNRDREYDRGYERRDNRYGRPDMYGPDRGHGYAAGSDYGYGREFDRAGYSGYNDYGGPHYGNYNNARNRFTSGQNVSHRGHDYDNLGYTPTNYGNAYYPGQRSRTWNNTPNRGYSSYGTSNDRDWMDRTRDEVSSWFGDEDARRRRFNDRQEVGQHRGRGPKGYQRSDSRIEEDINDRLSDDSHIDASDIEVQVKDNTVILSGTVDSRFAKRHAEDLVEGISGVTNIENRLHIGHYQTPGNTGTEKNTGAPDTSRQRSEGKSSAANS